MSKTVDTITKAIVMAVHNKDYENLEYMVKDILGNLDQVPVKVWREDDTVKFPTYGKPGDACMDVYVHRVEEKGDGRIVYHTGLHFALPEGYEMEIRPRSSNTKTMAVMQNAPGTLDQGYRGELMLVHRELDNIDGSADKLPSYKVGDRVAQVLVRRREYITFEEVATEEELGTTDRGTGGFGSTGK